MNQTPNANRLHIALFGRRNSGKSSLVNALTGQDTVIVSPTPGTTTDPVTKAMEIHPLGPCLLIDTPGFDDEGELGEMRVERTLKIIGKTDIALLLCETGDAQEQEWLQRLKERGIPVILLLKKADFRQDTASVVLRIEKEAGSRCGQCQRGYRHSRYLSHPPRHSGKVACRFRRTNHHREPRSRR